MSSTKRQYRLLPSPSCSLATPTNDVRCMRCEEKLVGSPRAQVSTLHRTKQFDNLSKCTVPSRILDVTSIPFRTQSFHIASQEFAVSKTTSSKHVSSAKHRAIRIRHWRARRSSGKVSTFQPSPTTGARFGPYCPPAWNRASRPWYVRGVHSLHEEGRFDVAEDGTSRRKPAEAPAPCVWTSNQRVRGEDEAPN